MIKLALDFWFKFPQKLRFLLVGGWNTLFSLLLFTLIFEVIQNYKTTLVISHLASVLQSFLTFKVFVFRSQGNFLKEYIKINLVYLIYFVINFALLFVAIQILNIYAVTAQLFITCLMVILSYLMNKYFTFNNVKRK